MDNRTKIIDAAIEVFANKGKYGARMEEIAARAEINKAMLYYYFSSKNNLFYEALRTILARIFKEINRELEKADLNDKNPTEKIDRLARLHFKSFSRHLSYPKLVMNALINDSENLQKIFLQATEGAVFEENNIYDRVFKEGVSQNMFRNIDYIQLMISVIGMNIIYCWAKPIAEVMFNLNVCNEEEFMKLRENSVVDLILNGILKKDAS